MTNRARRDHLYAVGRQKPLARIEEDWQRYRESGRGSVVLVCGAPAQGTGEFVERIRRRVASELDCLHAAPGGAEASEPLELIAELLEQFDPELVAGVVDELELSDSVRSRLPGGAGDGGGSGARPPIGAGQFYAEVARLIGELGARSDVAALVIEQVDLADDASRAILRRLAEQVEAYGIWLVLQVDISTPPGEGFVDDLKTDPSSATLEPLQRDEIEQFLRRYFNRPIDDAELVSRLEAASGGSPVILEQLLDLLVEQGVVTPDWERWRVDHDRLASIAFPTESHRLLVAHLEGLSERVQAFCRAAAVWGRHIRLGPIAEGLGATEADVEEWAESAARQRILLRPREADERAAAYRFVHGSVRAALLESIDESTRRQLHQRYAEWLDGRDDDGTYRLARHYLHGDGSNPERRFEVSLEAGRRAVEEFAFERAETFLDAALESAEAAGREPPASAYFLRGKAEAGLERPRRAQGYFERAAEAADDPFDRAEARLAQSRLHAGHLDIPSVDATTREALDLLDDPLPESRLGLVFVGLVRLIKVLWWRHVAPPAPAGGRRGRRQELRGFAYHSLSMVGRFREDSLLSMTATVGRLHAAIPLDQPVAMIRAYATEITAYAFTGKVELSERRLAEARELADEVDTAWATTFLDGIESIRDEMIGRPVEGAALAERVLGERADQIQHYLRSSVMLVLVINYGLRGESRRVLSWYERWKQMQGLEEGEYPPSPIYTIVMVHARLVGDDALADELRRISREHIEGTDDPLPFTRKKHRSAFIIDDVLRGASAEEIEETIAAREALGTESAGSYVRTPHFVFTMYARRYLLDAAESDDGRRHREFEAAVERLQELALHPTYRAHATIGRAECHYRRGDTDAACEVLGRAESLAHRYEVPWVAFEVERLRAAWFGEADRERGDRVHAAAAMQVARRLGWMPAVERLRRRFDPPSVKRASVATPSSSNDETARSPVSQSGPMTRSRSTRQIELERQLDALLEVSSATSSILEPEEVSRVVVDASIRVLGAQRGMLFLAGDASDRELAEADPHVVRTRDGDPGDDAPGFSRTILRTVVEEGEPMVLRSTEQGAELGAESVVIDQMRSVVAAPFWLEDELVGVIYLDNHLAAGVFGPPDVQILQAMANHIPLALETARKAQLEVDIASERERRAYAEGLREFTQQVNATLDVNEILEHLVGEIRRTARVDRVDAAVVDGDHVELKCTFREGEVTTAPFEERRRLETGEFVASVLETGANRLLSRVTEADRQCEPAIAAGVGAWLALPIVSGRETIGIVTLSSGEPGGLDSVNLEHLVALSSQAGIAIEKTDLATIDPLTDLYNRRKFFDLASEAFERAQAGDEPLTVMMIDFDDFKAINDEHGHAGGDAVLKTVAARSLEVLRSTDIVGRYGGDEFAVVLPMTDADEAVEQVAPRLREAVAGEPVRHAGDLAVEVTVSLGAARCREEDREVRDILERADEAVYEAKEAGKDAIAVSDDAPDT